MNLSDELVELSRKGEMAKLEEQFLAAISSDPNRLDLFMEVGRALTAGGRPEPAGQLLAMLVEHYNNQGTAQQRVELLSFVAQSLKKERQYRLALIEALGELHSDRRAFEVFVEPSGLKGHGDVKTALEKLEQMLKFDVGSYVLHDSGWGIGRVEDSDAAAGELVLTFEGGRQHQLPVSSAIEILKPVPREDWRVLRAFHADELRNLCEESPGEVIAKILRQASRPLDTAFFRESLEGTVIPKEKWSKWWASARKNALKRRDVEIPGGRGSRLIFVEANEDDPFSEMRRVLSARQVLDLAHTFLRNATEEDKSNKLIMQEFVTLLMQGAARHAPAKDSAPLELLLLADEVAEEHGFERDAIQTTLRNRTADAGAYPHRIVGCKVLRLQKRSLALVKELFPEDWHERYLVLLDSAGIQLIEHVISELQDAGAAEQVQHKIREAIRRPEQYPELIVWGRRRHGNKRFAELLAPFAPKDLLNRSLSLGEGVGKTTSARLTKMQKTVVRELLDNGGREFRSVLRKLNVKEAELLERRIERFRRLSEDNRRQLLTILLDEHDSLQAEPEILHPHEDDDTIYSTDQGIQKIQQEYDRLVNEELPRIFEAVGKAASFGDLSENAEYTAALEERASATAKAEKMQEDMRKGKRIDTSLLEDGVVTIGTRVHARNEDTGEQIGYTILGPWDADLDNDILDYHAPLARAFLTHRAGEKVEAHFGGRVHRYEILSIAPAIDQPQT